MAYPVQINLFSPMWGELTPRETEAAELLCEGYSNAEIGTQLQISEHTVKIMLRSMFKKFRIKYPYAKRIRLAVLLTYEKYPHLKPDPGLVSLDWLCNKETNTNTVSDADSEIYPIFRKRRSRKSQGNSDVAVSKEYIRWVLHLPSTKQSTIQANGGSR